MRRAEGPGRLELGVRRDRSRRSWSHRRWTAPCTAFSPTPPVPITTTRRPGLDSGGVDDGAEAGDHAAGEQRRAGRAEAPAGITTAWDASTTTSSAKAAGAEPLGDRVAVGIRQRPAPRRARTSPRRAPARRARTARMRRRSGSASRRRGRPRRNPATPAPTSTTTPAASCPNTAGSEPPQAPSR